MGSSSSADCTRAQALRLLRAAKDYQDYAETEHAIHHATVSIPTDKVTEILGITRDDIVQKHLGTCGDTKGLGFISYNRENITAELNPENPTNLEKIAGSSYEAVQALSNVKFQKAVRSRSTRADTERTR